MILLVVPFATAQLDAFDLARYCTAETAAALQLPGVEARLLADELEISAEAMGAAAALLKVDAALGATLTLQQDQLELDVLLADAAGNTRGVFHQSLTVGAVPQLGQVLARAALLALGEDAAAPPEPPQAEVPPALALRLVRASQNGDWEDLLALCREQRAEAASSGGLRPARRAFFSLVRQGQGGPRMPALHAALERFVEEHEADAEGLLLLAQSRAAHLDDAGARELFLRARAAAGNAALEAEALQGLTALAVAGGRNDEAVAHLRSAVKLTDDPRLYATLGALLRDPGEAIAALTRATILAPEDAELQLKLARALREHDPRRALAAAAEALRLSDSDSMRAEAREELKLLLQ